MKHSPLMAVASQIELANHVHFAFANGFPREYYTKSNLTC